MEKLKPKTKEYYSVKIETLIPVIVTYKVFAETPEEAIELAKKLGGQQLNSAPIIIWARMKRLKATVYSTGTSLVRLVKTLTN